MKTFQSKFLSFFILYIVFFITGLIHQIESGSDQFILFTFVLFLIGGLGFVAFYGFPKPVIDIIYIGFIIRFAASFVSYTEVLPLEGSLADALHYEKIALRFYNSGIEQFIIDFLTNISEVYSFLIAILYFLFAPNILIPIFVNVIIGLLVIELTYKIAIKFWDVKTARLAVWIVALFPYSVIFSSVMVREILLTWLLCLSVYSFLTFAKNLSLNHFIRFNLFGFLATLTHAGVVGLLLVNMIGVFILIFKKQKKIRPFLFAIIYPVLFGFLIVQVLEGNFRIGKLEFLSTIYTKKETKFTETTLNAFNNNYSHGTYRPPLKPNSFSDVIFATPKVLFHFIFEPLPHRLLTQRYPILYTSSFFYISSFLIILVYFRKIAPLNFELKYLISLLFFIYLFYAFGSYQFNQSIRHLCKPLPIFAVVVSPAILAFFRELIKSTGMKLQKKTLEYLIVDNLIKGFVILVFTYLLYLNF